MKKIALLLGLSLCSTLANAAYTQLSRIPIQYQNSSGNNASGHLLCAYASGTTTPQAMYSDNAGTSAGTSITLDSDGYPASVPVVWLDNTLTYKFKLMSAGTCSSGTNVWTVDNIIPEGQGSSAIAGNFAATSSGTDTRSIEAYNTNGGIELSVDGATGDGELWNTNSSGAQEDQLFDFGRNSGNSFVAAYYNNSKVWETVSGGVSTTGTQTISGILSVDDTTNSTSGTAGSIHTDGGIGVAKDIFLAGDFTLYDAVNEGNPVLSIGSSATNVLEITANYNTSVQTLNFIGFETKTSSATDDHGEYRFSVDEVGVLTIDDGGLEVVGDITAFGSISLSTPPELTISGGSVTATASYHTIDTEGDAASDTLTTISGGTIGDILVISAANGARTVTVSDSADNIELSADCTLDNIEDTLTIIYNGSNWVQIACANNGA